MATLCSQGRQVGAGGTGWTMGFPEWGSRTLRTLGVLGGLLSPHESGLGSGEWLEGGGAPRWVQDPKGHFMSDLDFFSPKYEKLCADVSVYPRPHQFPGPADSTSPGFSLCVRGAPGPLSDLVPGVYLPGGVPAPGDGAAHPPAGPVQSL